MSELFLVIFYHDQITAILVTENIVKYVKLFHHSLISGSLPEKLLPKNYPKTILLHQTIRREFQAEMVINYQMKLFNYFRKNANLFVPYSNPSTTVFVTGSCG